MNHIKEIKGNTETILLKLFKISRESKQLCNPMSLFTAEKNINFFLPIYIGS